MIRSPSRRWLIRLLGLAAVCTGLYAATALFAALGPERVMALDAPATELRAWLRGLDPAFLLLRWGLYGLIVYLLPDRVGEVAVPADEAGSTPAGSPRDAAQASARLRRRLIGACALYEVLFGLNLPGLLSAGLRG